MFQKFDQSVKGVLGHEIVVFSSVWDSPLPLHNQARNQLREFAVLHELKKDVDKDISGTDQLESAQPSQSSGADCNAAANADANLQPQPAGSQDTLSQNQACEWR